jgi:cardiolipin synthase
MFSGISLAYGLTLHGLVTLLAVFAYVVAAHVMHQRRHPAAAIAWVLFILLVPYVALPAFLTFGSRKLARPRGATTPKPPAPDAGSGWAEQTLLALGQPAALPYRRLALHADGHAALVALWQTIDGARHSIDVCTFILGDDSIGHEVIERLAARSRAGVRVRLLLDGLGSLMAGRPKLSGLTAAGVDYRLFVPPWHSPLKGRTNLRNHRKMLIADAGQAEPRLWCGGRNLAREYFLDEPGKPAWHDLTWDLTGSLVEQASALFAHDWAFAGGQPSPWPALPRPSADGGASSGAGSASAQIVASGPDQIDDTVYSLLVTAAYRAQRRITLVTPYFVPDAGLLLALQMAARRGVAVDLVIPRRSNHALSDVGRSRALRSLAAAGGRVWLVPYMLHAKLAVIDDGLALAGSANLDSRSLFLNYELMLAFHNPADVARFAAWAEGERRSAAAYVPRQPGLLRDVGEGLVLWVGFQL